MRITILGSGTSCGVPQIGCTCAVCTSQDPRDKRLRCSSLVEVRGKRILIDCSPDFRQQMLGIDFKPLDAVLITHEHYDHVGGLDDLRPYSVFGDVNVYAEKFCADHLMEMEPHVPIKVGEDVEVIPIRVMHAKLPIVGFRIDNFAYITDMKTIPPTELSYLQGIDYMIVNGLRHKEHPSHQSIDDAITFAQQLGVKEAWLVHMSHHIQPHAEEEKTLPPGIHLAYDGEVITF